MIGSLNCRLCGANYQMPIHHLHEPIDVFSEWLDDCEAAANPRAGAASAAEPRYDDEDDELPAGSGLNQKKSASSDAGKKSIDLGMSSDEDDD